MKRILRVIFYGTISGIIFGIVFFAVGMYFEVETRETESITKYDSKKGRYKTKEKLIQKDISGEMTSYVTVAGIVIGIVFGVIWAMDKDVIPINNETLKSNNDTKKLPPDIS